VEVGTELIVEIGRESFLELGELAHADVALDQNDEADADGEYPGQPTPPSQRGFLLSVRARQFTSDEGTGVNPGQWSKLNYASMEGGICEVFGE